MISAGQLISERVMLKRDRFFVVSARDGSITPGEFAGDGLWAEDTRILSAFRVLINGVEPASIDFQADDASASFVLEGGGLHLTRTRFVESGLHERITVTNPGTAIVDTVLEVEFAVDLAAMLAVRSEEHTSELQSQSN